VDAGVLYLELFMIVLHGCATADHRRREHAESAPESALSTAQRACGEQLEKGCVTEWFEKSLALIRLYLPAILDNNPCFGRARLRAVALNFLDNVHALCDRAEDDVLTVEPVGLDSAEEEL